MLHIVSVLTLLIALFACPQTSWADEKVNPDDEIVDWYGEGINSMCNPKNGQLQALIQDKPPNGGFVKRYVYCAKGVIIPATYKILSKISDRFKDVIKAACLLAIVVWGIAVVAGRGGAWREGVTVLIKIAAVLVMTDEFGKGVFGKGMYTIMIDIIDELIKIVSSEIGFDSKMKCITDNNLDADDVWGRVDCMLETLVGGIFGTETLVAGIVGFLLACVFSGWLGIFMALIVGATVLLLIYSILRAVYITIMSYIAVALMALVSPIFITLALFRGTFGYFEKWLKLTIGFMLQPLFIFAYFSMLIFAYDVTITGNTEDPELGKFSVYRALAGDAAKDDPDFKIGNYLKSKNVYKDQRHLVSGVGVDPKQEAEVTGGSWNRENIGFLGGVARDQNSDATIFALAKKVQNIQADFNAYTVDLPIGHLDWEALYSASGVDTGGGEDGFFKYLAQVFLSVLMAAITMYIFFLLLDLLPYIGAGVAGESFSMPVLGQDGGGTPGMGMVQQFKATVGSVAGGK